MIQKENTQNNKGRASAETMMLIPLFLLFHVMYVFLNRDTLNFEEHINQVVSLYQFLFISSIILIPIVWVLINIKGKKLKNASDTFFAIFIITLINFGGFCFYSIAMFIDFKFNLLKFIPISLILSFLTVLMIPELRKKLF